jgi:hypothetical protein
VAHVVLTEPWGLNRAAGRCRGARLRGGSRHCSRRRLVPVAGQEAAGCTRWSFSHVQPPVRVRVRAPLSADDRPTRLRSARTRGKCGLHTRRGTPMARAQRSHAGRPIKPKVGSLSIMTQRRIPACRDCCRPADRKRRVSAHVPVTCPGACQGNPSALLAAIRRVTSFGHGVQRAESGEFHFSVSF